MSGFGPGRKLPHVRFDLPRRQSEDPCDLQFRTDLVGVRPAILDVQQGDTLDVELVEQGGARSVVCLTEEKQVVGALAAFQGFAQLIRCLALKNQYLAEVEVVSKSQCTVLVRRGTQ